MKEWNLAVSCCTVAAWQGSRGPGGTRGGHSQRRFVKGPQNTEKGARADEKAFSLFKSIDINLEIKGRTLVKVVSLQLSSNF